MEFDDNFLNIVKYITDDKIFQLWYIVHDLKVLIYNTLDHK